MTRDTRGRFPLGQRQIRIQFQGANDVLELHYQLYEHPLINRWLTLVQLSGFCDGKIGGVNFSGQLLDDEEFLVNSLNVLILKINTHLKKLQLDDLIIEHTVHRGVPQQILNELHRYFELHAYDDRFKEPLQNTFRLLNLFIHRMENFSDNKKNNCVLIEVTPAEWNFLPLEADDYQLFSADWVWGQLLLNYCMLGVPTLQAFLNKADPKPQSAFSAGVYLSFVDDNQFNQMEELKAWLQERQMDPDDPQCAIGYIPLGEMVFPKISSDTNARIEFLKKFKTYSQVLKFEIDPPVNRIDIGPSRQIPKGKY